MDGVDDPNRRSGESLLSLRARVLALLAEVAGDRSRVSAGGEATLTVGVHPF